MASKKTQQQSADNKSVTEKKTRKKKEATTEKAPKKPKENKPKQLSPFDIIGMMFKNTGEFEQLSNYALERNFFMINRTCSIAYPLQAQWFNKLGISGVLTIKAWRDFLVRQHGYGRVPSFVYTRGGKASSEKQLKQSVLKDYPLDVRKAYCDFYKLSMKDLNDLESFNPDMLIKHMEQFKKLTSGIPDIEKSKL